MRYLLNENELAEGEKNEMAKNLGEIQKYNSVLSVLLSVNITKIGAGVHICLSFKLCFVVISNCCLFLDCTICGVCGDFYSILS